MRNMSAACQRFLYVKIGDGAINNSIRGKHSTHIIRRIDEHVMRKMHIYIYVEANGLSMHSSLAYYIIF